MSAPKIICLCCFRDAESNLAKFIEHLKPFVDGFIFLDDRSNPMSTGSVVAGFCAGDKVLSILCRFSNSQAPFAYEVQNRQILLNEAINEGASMLLCLDADERVEKRFLEQLRALAGPTIYTLAVRDLWDDAEHYRVDGVWSKKRKAIYFPCPKKIYREPVGALHTPWVGPFQEPWTKNMDFNLYHLGSISRELRWKRVSRHETADPKRKWQDDYGYLNDDTGLQLEEIPAGRGWR